MAITLPPTPARLPKPTTATRTSKSSSSSDAAMSSEALAKAFDEVKKTPQEENPLHVSKIPKEFSKLKRQFFVPVHDSFREELG
jgi:hypothetical protein